MDTLTDIKKVHQALSQVEKANGIEQGKFKIVAQIESGKAFINMKDIFQYDREQIEGRGRIIAAAFGADDFTADIGVHRSDNDQELDFARKLFALTCSAFDGLTSIDTPYVHYKNPEGLRQELKYLKSIGMKAKFAIHPTQVPIIN